MIYEMRTYALKPGTVAEYEGRFGEALPHREKYSRLGAFWHTEFGPLNQVIHVWPYEDLSERARVRAEASKDPHWPPPGDDIVLEMASEILMPAPFMRPMDRGELGSIYEMRTYSYQPGSIPEVIKRWGEAIPHREKYSPLAACWYTEIGGINKWIHVWPYRDMAHRDQVRRESFDDPLWPRIVRGTPSDMDLARPGLLPLLGLQVKQESTLLVPAAFSPMR